MLFRWTASTGSPDGYLLYLKAENGLDWVGVVATPEAEVPCLARPYESTLQRLYPLPFHVRPGSPDPERSFITARGETWKWAEGSEAVLCVPEPSGALLAGLVLLAALGWGRRPRRLRIASDGRTLTRRADGTRVDPSRGRDPRAGA